MVAAASFRRRGLGLGDPGITPSGRRRRRRRHRVRPGPRRVAPAAARVAGGALDALGQGRRRCRSGIRRRRRFRFRLASAPAGVGQVHRLHHLGRRLVDVALELRVGEELAGVGHQIGRGVGGRRHALSGPGGVPRGVERLVEADVHAVHGELAVHRAARGPRGDPRRPHGLAARVGRHGGHALDDLLLFPQLLDVGRLLRRGRAGRGGARGRAVLPAGAAPPHRPVRRR